MALPRMQSVQSIATDPVPGQTFSDWYNVLLLVRSMTGAATLHFRPYNFETKEFYGSDDKDLRVDVADFWTFVGERPTLAQAMGSLIAELGKVAQEKQLEGLIAAEQAQEAPDAAQLDAWQQSLASVRTSMGM